MDSRDRKELRRDAALAATLLLWVLAAWLLFPLTNLDRVDMTNAKTYLYRSAMGLTILIIFFGKTVFDLIAGAGGRRMPALNVALLTLYSLALVGGIVFTLVRMVMVAARSRSGSGVLF